VHDLRLIVDEQRGVVVHVLRRLIAKPVDMLPHREARAATCLRVVAVWQPALQQRLVVEWVAAARNEQRVAVRQHGDRRPSHLRDSVKVADERDERSGEGSEELPDCVLLARVRLLTRRERQAVLVEAHRQSIVAYEVLFREVVVLRAAHATRRERLRQQSRHSVFLAVGELTEREDDVRAFHGIVCEFCGDVVKPSHGLLLRVAF